MVDDKRQYDKFAQAYTDAVTEARRYFVVPTFKKLVSRRMVSDRRVLDLACGFGYFTNILSSYRPQSLLGVDISGAEIKIAKKKFPGIKFLVGDVAKLDPRRLGKFDLCTAVYLFNYVKTRRELEKMVKTISSLLSDGGQLVAIIPHFRLCSKPDGRFHYGKRISRLIKKAGQPSDGERLLLEFENQDKVKIFFYFWSKETYEKLFKEAGLSIRWNGYWIDGKALERLGADYFKPFVKNPTVMSFTAQKK